MVLTVEATEITTCAGEGETGGTRMEVVEGFLLDGVDGEGAGMGVDFAEEHAGVVATAAAETGLAVGDVAVVGAQLTHDRSIVLLAIISTFH